jgi:hypothetical protein
MGGFDLTFPKVPMTGEERSLDELTRPDERSITPDIESLQAPFFEFERRLPDSVPTKLRERIVVARQLAVYGYFCHEFHAVSLFWSVSGIEMALKMKFEQMHLNPIRLIRGIEGAEESCQVRVNELEESLRSKWRIPEMKWFDFSFKSLLKWAFRAGLLPEDIGIPIQEVVNRFDNHFAFKVFPERAQKDGLLGPNPTWGEVQKCWQSLNERQQRGYQSKASTVLIEELPKFRNMMAHPQRFNFVTVPRSALSGYQLLIDMVSRLWPKPESNEGGS